MQDVAVLRVHGKCNAMRTASTSKHLDCQLTVKDLAVLLPSCRTVYYFCTTVQCGYRTLTERSAEAVAT